MIKKRKLWRRATLLALLLFFLCLQNVPWLPVLFGGVRAVPVLPYLVAVAMLDQEFAAVVLGVVGGLAWDSQANTHGFHSIYLLCWSLLVALLMRYLLNRNWITISLLSVVNVAGYFVLRWGAAYVQIPGAGVAFATQTLPSILYTLAFMPLCYALVAFVVRKTARKQGGVITP